MLNLAKIVKPWKEAGSLCANLNLYGFWDEHTFLTKSGDLGLIMRVSGVDYECVDLGQQNHAVHRIESAMKAFDDGFHVYQYLFKRNRPAIPFAHYDDPMIDVAIDQRRKFFEKKRDRLYEIEIFYAVVLEGGRSKTGFLETLKRAPSDPQGVIREIKAQFSGTQTRLLLRRQIESDLQKLHTRATNFTRHLNDIMRVEVLGQQQQFTFLRRLVNFDDWRIAGRPKDTQFLDFQVTNSDIEAERDHLRIGSHYVRLLTMKESIGETGPMVLDKLLKIGGNFHVVTEWSRVPKSKARGEIKSRRRHFNADKGSATSKKKEEVAERDDLIDESMQDDIEKLGKLAKLLGNGETMGSLSFTVVLHSLDRAALDSLAGEFTSLFTDNDGTLFPETYNQLFAFFATVPGNYAHNLRKLDHTASNHADLSFLFTIHEGERWNAHLHAEYLAVLETDNETPYYLNLHNGEVAHSLILGKTGSGKSFLLNFLLMSLQKYRPMCFLFDLGGSFRSLTEVLGGSYLTVGQESRDFTINPFSLDLTPENQQFLFSFFQVLIEGKDRRYPLDTRGERSLWEAIENMYSVPPQQRTLTTFAAIIGHPLAERLHRWTKAGQYGFLFDNVDDTLSLSSFQTFDFAGWDKDSAALEPLLFYILHRASQRILDPALLGVFKLFAIDEAWSFLQNVTIRKYIMEAEQTWRRSNAAMVLATQSLRQLEDAGILPELAEACPTKIFLANPGMNREVYKEAFHLNDTELNLIAGLLPHGEMLVRKEKSSKKLRLNVDSVSYWIATNNAPDNLKKQDYFARYGVAEGVRQLAQQFPRERGDREAAPPKPQTQSQGRRLTLAS